MSKHKDQPEVKVARGWYKGYYVKALREDPQHPDFYLVAEYDKLQEKEEVNK